jgi:hypothetical protein
MAGTVRMWPKNLGNVSDYFKMLLTGDQDAKPGLPVDSGQSAVIFDPSIAADGYK